MVIVAIVVSIVVRWARSRFQPKQNHSSRSWAARGIAGILIPAIALGLAGLGVVMLLKSGSGPPDSSILMVVIFTGLWVGAAIPVAVITAINTPVTKAVLVEIEYQSGISIRGFWVISIACLVGSLSLAALVALRN
jgi:ABC-type antimicrobial peptide transport system permease subunit